MAYTSLLDRLGLHRRELRAWAYYDVANSAWMTTMLQAFSPAFFVPFAASQLAAGRRALALRLRHVVRWSSWSGLLGPWLGALADYKGRKKAFMGAFLGAGARCSRRRSTSCARASGCSRSRSTGSRTWR